MCDGSGPMLRMLIHSSFMALGVNRIRLYELVARKSFGLKSGVLICCLQVVIGVQKLTWLSDVILSPRTEMFCCVYVSKPSSVPFTYLENKNMTSEK